MHKLKSLALLALAGLGLSASGGVTTNDWWDVPFTSPTAATDVEGYGNVTLTVGEIGNLTNNWDDANQQPYFAGLWTMVDGDESYITNEFNPSGSFGGDNCLKLDTQGNDLTWTVTNNNAMADGLKALVDADLYLVGSDSEPTEFDENNDVQTAVYLKNEIEENSGETTNSVLCVYVYNGTSEANEWQELDGVELEDNAWAHVQVLVDHSDDGNNLPTVQVFVNGTQMHARNGDATSWTAANGSTAQTAGRVSSVAFRGTGAVDNFVGQTLLETFSSYDFTAEVYMNGQLQETGTDGNVTRVVNAEAGATKTAKFEGFLTCNADFDREVDPTWCLAKIEITNFVNGSTTILNYSWNSTSFLVEGDESDAVEIITASGWQTGLFDVSPTTEGATANSTIVKIYFEDLPEEGTFNANATTTIGGTTTTDSQKVKPSDFEGGATKTIEWTFPAEKNGNVLSKIQLYNGATLEYANKTATVTVTTNAALQADTLFAAATYVPGTLADGQDLKDDGGVDGLYTFTAYVPPVAIRVSADGTTTNECSSLRQAIEDYAQNGDTVYLVADDRVSFTTEALEIEIDKALTIDGGSNTLFGVSDYSAGGYHDIFVIGNGALTIKDLKFSEFGDTATSFQYETYPIVTSGSYTGQLTLDGVTIDKFARTAVNLNGGTVLITNCTFTADPTAYFQTGVETLNAVVTVVDTTITGVNSTITGEDPEGAAVFTLKGHDGYTGTGSITVLSGEYSGQFIVAAEALATGSVILSNGTFIATADAAESAFNLDAGNVEISGGWFDREPEAKYIAQGLAAYEDAPGEEAPWTVRAAKVTIDFYVDGAVYATTSVVVGATGYAPADPEKAADAQYAYAFTGWTNVVGESYSAATLPAATTATNYYAAFSVVVRSYEVEWVVDGVYTTNTWNYDATPSWNENDPTAVPTKDSTEATNFTFKAWTPEVAPVTGPGASYTATWTETARTYAITFQTNGVDYATVDAEWHATGYAPAAPAAPEGKVFKGWALSTAPTTVLDTLPEVSGAATYVAVFEDASQLQPVDPGQSMSAAEKAANPPVAIDGTDFVVHFKGQSGVTYQLVAMPTCTGTTEQWLAATPVGTAVTCSDETAVLELKAPMGTDTVKFFKIKASK